MNLLSAGFLSYITGNRELLFLSFIYTPQVHKNTWLHIKAGDKQAYAEAYTFYYKKLFNYGRKFTQDEFLVEDAIQEILLQLWTNRERLSSILSPETYLFSSFRYTLLRKIQQSRRHENLRDGFEPEPGFSAEHFIINKETDAAIQQQLLQAMRELTARQREAIFLRFYEGLSYEEVASVLNISVKATYKIMARALLQLKDKISISMVALLWLLRHGS